MYIITYVFVYVIETIYQKTISKYVYQLLGEYLSNVYIQ